MNSSVNSKKGEVFIITSRALVKPECIDDFLKITAPLIEATRQEKGCMVYDLLQDPRRPEVFLFYEEYRDEAAQQFHGAQPYLAEFRELSKPLLRQEADLTIYRAVEI